MARSLFQESEVSIASTEAVINVFDILLDQNDTLVRGADQDHGESNFDCVKLDEIMSTYSALKTHQFDTVSNGMRQHRTELGADLMKKLTLVLRLKSRQQHLLGAKQTANRILLLCREDRERSDGVMQYSRTALNALHETQIEATKNSESLLQE
jgi:hypothetical protein